MQSHSKPSSAQTKVNENSQMSRLTYATNQRLSLPSVNPTDNSMNYHDKSHILTYVKNSENYKVS